MDKQEPTYMYHLLDAWGTPIVSSTSRGTIDLNKELFERGDLFDGPLRVSRDAFPLVIDHEES